MANSILDSLTTRKLGSFSWKILIFTLLYYNSLFLGYLIQQDQEEYFAPEDLPVVRNLIVDKDGIAIFEKILRLECSSSGTKLKYWDRWSIDTFTP